MIVDAGRQRIPLRRATVDVARSCGGSTSCCCSRSPASSATACGRSRASRGSTSPATRLLRHAPGDRRGDRRVGLVVAILDPALALPAPLARRLRRDDRADDLRLRLRGGRPRVEALDRPRARSSSSRPSSGRSLFVLAIAGFLVERQHRIGRLRTVASAIGLAAVPMVLVFLQPGLRHRARLRRRARRRPLPRRRPLAPPRRCSRSRAGVARPLVPAGAGSRCSSRTRPRA